MQSIDGTPPPSRRPVVQPLTLATETRFDDEWIAEVRLLTELDKRGNADYTLWRFTEPYDPQLTPEEAADRVASRAVKQFVRRWNDFMHCDPGSEGSPRLSAAEQSGRYDPAIKGGSAQGALCCPDALDNRFGQCNAQPPLLRRRLQ